jgi:hypothetical protein
MGSLLLPDAHGEWQPYEFVGKSLQEPHGCLFRTRVAYAAAHVVLDPHRTTSVASPVLDWDLTLAYRRHLWSLGFGVAEAMDTSQRGMGLDWPLALELIQRSAAEARTTNALIAGGAGTDHLSPTRPYTLDDIVDAYLLQCEAIEATGSRIILMASRALCRTAQSPDEYALVYARVLSQLKQPAILHWLGPMFDPALAGYWGSSSLTDATQSCLEIIRANQQKVDGIKISLLDADREIAMRRQLPPGVRMYTGDDFNYDRLILGDDWGGEHGHSDALLGIFDAIAPAAALALEALDTNDLARYHALFAPTIPLSRHIFQTPTYAYKTGIVFLAWLNGFQPHFRMVAGAESARSISHLMELFRLADAANLLRDPELAAGRMSLMLAGVR